MDSPSDSDLSEGMRELIGQGFAIKQGRDRIAPETKYLGETLAQLRDTDVSHVQRPLTLSVSAGVASTHGLTPATLESVTAAGRNLNTKRPTEQTLLKCQGISPFSSVSKLKTTEPH